VWRLTVCTYSSESRGVRENCLHDHQSPECIRSEFVTCSYKTSYKATEQHVTKSTSTVHLWHHVCRFESTSTHEIIYKSSYIFYLYVVCTGLKKTTRSSPHHVAQHRPTKSETTPPYAPRSSRFGSNHPLWRMMSMYGATQSWVACQKRWWIYTCSRLAKYLVESSYNNKNNNFKNNSN